VPALTTKHETGGSRLRQGSFPERQIEAKAGLAQGKPKTKNQKPKTKNQKLKTKNYFHTKLSLSFIKSIKLPSSILPITGSYFNVITFTCIAD